MNTDIEKTPENVPLDLHTKPVAWQPFTPKGIAAFAQATVFRLLAVEFVMSILAALSLFWFVKTAWIPPIQQAIEQLPKESALMDGRLIWPDRTPKIMGENRFLALAVDPDDTDQTDQSSDLKFELTEHEIRLVGFLGSCRLTYPRLLRISLSPNEAVPWWGAWKQAGLGLILFLTPLCLFLIWACLGFIYAPIAKYLSTFGDRSLSWLGSWKMGTAALMPGALLMTVSIVLYGMAQIDLVKLGFLTLFHLVIGWIYLAIAVYCLPKEIPNVPLDNPFMGAPDSQQPTPKKKDNPFGV